MSQNFPCVFSCQVLCAQVVGVTSSEALLVASVQCNVCIGVFCLTPGEQCELMVVGRQTRTVAT